MPDLPPGNNPKGWWAGVGAWLRQNLLQLPTLVVGFATLMGVSTLSSRMSTSEMLLQQIENLKKTESLSRNMSILAIEHTLSSRSPVEGVHHELLLIHVLGEVLIYDKAEGNLLGDSSDAGRQRLAHVHRILLASIRALNPRCAEGFAALADASSGEGTELSFLSSTESTDPAQKLTALIASRACRYAAALGFYTGWWPGKAPYDELLTTSVQQLAQISAISPANTQQPLSSRIESAASGKKGEEINLNLLSEEQIRSASEIVASAVVSEQQKRAVAEKHGKPPDLPHIFIHYDNLDLTKSMQSLAQQLSGEQLFVDRTLRYVAPSAKACASQSQVKLFHKGDQEVAEALGTAAIQAISKVGKPLLGQVILNDKNYPKDTAIGITDLSSLSLASKVPRGQLELWVISKGCSGGSRVG